MPYLPYTPAENEYLTENYGRVRSVKIAARLGRTVKSVDKRAVRMGLKSKGGPLYTGNPDGPRLRGSDHPNYRPPLKPYKRAGRLMIKRTENAEPESYSRYVWEQHNGPLTKRCIVRHLDGNPINCAIENLTCVSKEEHMLLNSIHRFGPEVTKITMAIRKLDRAIQNKENAT